ncbi:coenzyme F420-0:L-glutamate ligase [Tenggerimyces flavus]|uniref:Coenzyme F420-0:L-glutamate ligase n=1 Tax=Tenggerimyces flavus TaxID=1708749 RepID=A0ABV7YMS3_9ACTN|nr:coenzyme F420-0:L-glutamate ligase [Tenggerimyces flavus]MBM7789683.1 F420-0:gamma-glutamyl ligase [Tenggerimyces flavus]
MSGRHSTQPIEWTKIAVLGRSYGRCAIRTPWLSEEDDLTAILHEYTVDRELGDTIVVSEKVAILLTGRTISLDSVTVRPFARRLAKLVRPRFGSLGLSLPEKMQYVVDEVGHPRVAAAAAAALLTRPFGIRGAFYRIAGTLARDIDGGRPPYGSMLFPPLSTAHATALCTELERTLGAGVAIVDINDHGGSIRAASDLSLPADDLLQVLADNPLGQRSTGTPIGLVRPL